jgi:hypothetical protein
MKNLLRRLSGPEAGEIAIHQGNELDGAQSRCQESPSTMTSVRATRPCAARYKEDTAIRPVGSANQRSLLNDLPPVAVEAAALEAAQALEAALAMAAMAATAAAAADRREDAATARPPDHFPDCRVSSAPEHRG